MQHNATVEHHDTIAWSHNNIFAIIKLNDPNSEWKYHVIRTQRKGLRRSIKKLIRTDGCPDCAELYVIEYQPNAIKFFNIIKEKLQKKESKITVKGNRIKLLRNYTEEEFLRDVESLNNSRKEIEIPDDQE